jgi:tripartite-type tricarboxylate transporter receptor subunit TctC
MGTNSNSFKGGRYTIMKRSIIGMGLVVLSVVLVAGGPALGAPTEAEFYKGKVIDCIVPYKTGGGYDAWVRALSPFLGKVTGATVVVKNMPGAGSLVGTNRLYTSDPNGLTIGILNGPGAMQAQLTGLKGAKYDLLKFTLLGRLTADQRVVCVGAKSKFKTIEAMRGSKEPVKFGAPGLGSSMFMDAALLGEALDIKVDLITGYDTSEEVDLAVIRGEIDAASGSFSSKVDMINNKDMIPVMQLGSAKLPELAKVPNAAELPGMTSEDKQLLDLVIALGEVGRPMAAPPGVSSERARFLEESIKKALEDPEFVELTKKRQMEIIYMSSVQLRREVEKGLNLSPSVKKRFLAVMGRYQPKK